MMTVLQGLLDQANDRVGAQERIVVTPELAALHADFDAASESGGEAIAQALAVAGSSDHGLVRERRAHDPGLLLRVVEQALEVGAEALLEALAFADPVAGALHQVLAGPGREGDERRAAVCEVEVKGADGDVCLAGDVLGTRGLESVRDEQAAGRIEQTLAGLGLAALTPIDLGSGGNFDTHRQLIICQR